METVNRLMRYTVNAKILAGKKFGNLSENRDTKNTGKFKFGSLVMANRDDVMRDT